MSDYGIVEASRDSAIQGARSVAERLRKVAAEVDKLADEAEASGNLEGKVEALAAKVLNEVLGGVGNLHLAQVAEGSAQFAKAQALDRVSSRT